MRAEAWGRVPILVRIDRHLTLALYFIGREVTETKVADYGKAYSLGLNPDLVSALQDKYSEAAKNLGREVFYRSLVALYLEKDFNNIEEGIASPLVRPGPKPVLCRVFVSDHARQEIEGRFHMEVPFQKQVRIILAAFAAAGETPPLNVGMRSRWNMAPRVSEGA